MAAKREMTADEFIAEDGSQIIETVSGDDANDLIKFEKFMNETMTIMVHESVDENENPIIVVTVNGTNMPIVRGVETIVKRKYVEALARAKTVRYTQRTRDPREPDKIENVPHVILSYPFSVLEDRNPKGGAWLKGILGDRQI